MGHMSLLLLRSEKVEQIVLIDPNPTALGICAENLILNGYSTIARFVCALVADVDDRKIEFFTVGTGAAGSIYNKHAATAADLGSSYMASTLTLDTLVDQLGLLPDLIKVDTEGAEGLVMKGCTRIAQKQKTTFMVEMHSNPDLRMEDNARGILAWCRQNHFKALAVRKTKIRNSWILRKSQNGDAAIFCCCPMMHRSQASFSPLNKAPASQKYLCAANVRLAT